ncbi:hypothetical protein [Mesoplasma lactucae]|uniref:Uncharacterized protein n=1 Tax=Mesoplasma lactucae ATCC 49193 TaxID=81460 RepID=A0A291IRC6_9MOLU|nr:hypothetical protein [Mesoplasma lactucae]ATG97237.1 hypothetical protein CP520_00465 [Mesoplasma lactucae ATCC 49193]ATZ20320.1 hypothetical protein MLACT_v1c04990 [Mesoplasma lactucae ATCC 49193]MCL8216491.1 hypothetical protein [Mesoplasma lactucae ATCC 49193]
MAFLDEKTNNIVFNDKDKMSAWDNAPEISDADPKKYRVCMYCQFPMDYSDYVMNVKTKHSKDAWTIDLINIKKPKLVPKNFLAIHANCFGNRQNENEKRRLRKYRRTKWMMPKEGYKKSK